MKKKDIIDVYLKIRKIDNTIPDNVLDFMKNSAIEKLGDEKLQESSLNDDEIELLNLNYNESIIVTEAVKDLLFAKELISFGGTQRVWTFYEHDADEIIKIKNACK